MTTLEFLNRNSTGIINQLNWDEDIFKNEYNSKKDIINYNTDFVTNTLYVETEYEYDLKKSIINNNYIINVDKFEYDTIDRISLKINCSSELYKILFISYHISLGIYDRYLVKLLDTNLLDVCLTSYLNDYFIEENENILNIPLIQFNHLKYGFVCMNSKKLYFCLGNHSKEYFKLIDHNVINDIKIVIHGKKYHDISMIKKYHYKSMDIFREKTIYEKSGNYIINVDTKYKFLAFSLLKYNDNTILLTPNEINELLGNQPEIYNIQFQYENTVPWDYDIKYMKKISLFGINTYIIPLYPEFVNTKNALYYMKNSSKGIEPYSETYKIIVKTNIDSDKYDFHLTYFGEWTDD